MKLFKFYKISFLLYLLNVKNNDGITFDEVSKLINLSDSYKIGFLSHLIKNRYVKFLSYRTYSTDNSNMITATKKAKSYVEKQLKRHNKIFADSDKTQWRE